MATEAMNRFIAAMRYLLLRISTESSAARGIVYLLGAVGVYIDPTKAVEILTGTMVIAGAIAMLIPDALPKKQPEAKVHEEQTDEDAGESGKS